MQSSKIGDFDLLSVCQSSEGPVKDGRSLSIVDLQRTCALCISLLDSLAMFGDLGEDEDG